MISAPEAALALLSGASAAALPHRHQETANVGGHRRWRLPGQNTLETRLRQLVLPKQEKRPRQFQADACRSGLVDQNSAQGSDGFMEQGGSIPVSARSDAPTAARPTRNSTSVLSGWSGASGRRTASASSKRPLSTNALAPLIRGSDDGCDRSSAATAEACDRREGRRRPGARAFGAACALLVGLPLRAEGADETAAPGAFAGSCAERACDGGGSVG